MSTGRWVAVSAAWIATLISVALGARAGVAAQTGVAAGEPSAAPRVGCFRGQPLPSCRSLWIIEMQGEVPLVQTTLTLTYTGEPPNEIQVFERKLEWNLGHMLNLTPGYAVGGVLTVGTASTSLLSGVKLRGRRWLSADVSVELEGGLLYGVEVHPDASFGVTADARLNIRDQGSFYLRWDGLQVPPEQHPLVTSKGGFQQAVSVGAGLGSLPTLAGTGALGIGVLILLAIFVAAGGGA